MPSCAECKASTCWTEKTKLEKILIVSIILISALALGVLCAFTAKLLAGNEKDKEKESKPLKGDNASITLIKSGTIDKVCLTESCILSAATILENMDSKIPPCEDFYNFACGNFVKKTIVPEDSDVVRTISIACDGFQEQLKLMLEEPIQTNELKPFKMIKKFYKTCMDVDSIEKDGLNTIRSILKDLGGWPVLEGDKWAESRFDWKELTYKFREIGFFDDTVLKITVGRHLLESDRRILYIDESPFERSANLHERVWTIEDIQNAFLHYMVDAAVQFGADRNRSASELKDVLIFDQKMSELSYNQRLEERIPIDVTNLQQTFPNFTWMEFLNKLLASHNITVRADEKLIVNLGYLKGLEPLLQTVSKRTLANYMIWKFIAYCAPFLNRQLMEARLKFRQVFTGVSTFGMRWIDCLEGFIVDDDNIPRESLFIAAGALYVRKYFSNKDKENAQEMISNIHRSFQDTLEHVDWMDAATKKKALDKAKEMIMNSAYPDEFLDDKKILQFYEDDIELEENNYLKSVLKLNLFDFRRHFKKLREPVNRKEKWIDQRQILVCNAYYYFQSNSFKVPVGALQFPIFSSHRPNYLNYGSIGAIIGHEITHGFDSDGRNYDENGNRIQWWTPESQNSFDNKASCIAKQYSKYMLPEINMTVNGDLTLNENIADNGGFPAAYKAYQKWVEQHGTEKTLPGLDYTPNQLFWISCANFWCSKRKPASLQTIILSDTHGSPEFRVIGALSNNKNFADDFHCSVGSKMNPKEKCKLW